MLASISHKEDETQQNVAQRRQDEMLLLDDTGRNVPNVSRAEIFVTEGGIRSTRACPVHPRRVRAARREADRRPAAPKGAAAAAVSLHRPAASVGQR